MSNLKYAAFAAFIGLVATPAMADKAETKGGLKVKTDDGRFEMNIGGRIHFDTFLFSEDEDALFGSAGLTNRGGTAFRRQYLTLSGKAYGWKYKYEHDFTAATGGPSTREMWVSTNVGPGEIIIGQFKPFRGMEELTSSNEITMMERPVASASGIYAGRQFLMGLGYKGIVADQFGYGVDVMSLNSAGTTSEGMSYGGRGYWFPMSEDGRTVHLGVSYSVDHEDVGSAAASPAFTYGGRRGAVVNFGSPGGAGVTATTTGDQDTWALEAAAAFGPFTAQAEYANASLEESDGTQDSDVTAYYLQASWVITGEPKPYKKDRGAFGNPKPNGAYGAWELAARYESIENKDEDGANALCTITTGLVPAGFGAATATECSVDQITLGVNWYVNPNVRFMLNYYMAQADAGTSEDEPDAWSLRTQFAF